MYGGAPKSPPPGVKTVDDWSRYWKKADTRRVRVSRLFPLSREEDDPPADALIPANFLPQGASCVRTTSAARQCSAAPPARRAALKCPLLVSRPLAG